jgi:hypothetical protein
MLIARVEHQADDLCLAAGVLPQNAGVIRHHARRGVPPVIFDKLLWDGEVETGNGLPESSPDSTDRSASAAISAYLYVAVNRPSASSHCTFVRNRICSAGAGGCNYLSQYSAFSPITHRIPPRGSGHPPSAVGSRAHERARDLPSREPVVYADVEGIRLEAGQQPLSYICDKCPHGDCSSAFIRRCC